MSVTSQNRAQPASRARLLARLLTRLDRLRTRGEKASGLFTRWRLIIFLAGALSTVTAYKSAWYHLGNASLLLWIGVFITVAWYHNRLEERLHRLRLWRDIKQTHVARVTLDWSRLPQHEVASSSNHLYAADLDITGKESLLRLIDTTVSSAGRERLMTWLLDQPPPREYWHNRHAAVRESARLPLLRDRLVLESRLVDQTEINCRRLLAAVQKPGGYPALLPWFWCETCLAGVTWLLLVADWLDVLPGYWMFSFAAYAFIYLFKVGGHSEEVFEQSVAIHRELEKATATVRYLEDRNYNGLPALERICQPLVSRPTSPSRALREMARIFHRLSVRAHPLVHLALNALGPWDLYWTYRLYHSQARLRDAIPPWLDCLAEFEATAALGTFAYLHPDYAWPEPAAPMEPSTVDGQVAFLKADDLGHPLIAQPQRVGNDLHLEGLGQILLITGSNMSGKSTFLRTVGVNLCLAQAGAPVCASSFRSSWVRLVCCIRVDDSVASGLSFFYAEVKRLRALLDAARDGALPPVLFLIDEIFKGTNNRERLTGSRAFIKDLAQRNAFGLLTTHDLELTDLDRTIPTLRNAHFQETVAAGALQFDYKLRAGSCPTTNALRIMELEGLPVPKTGDGEG
jgi:hypothetical protein